MDTAQRALQVYERLESRFAPVVSYLDFETPWQLLAATMLSAQTTDAQVNRITPALFSRWPDPGSTAAADQAELEKAVRSTGFFRQKAANLKAAAAMIVDEFGGRVPADMQDLVRLPGVARKTANIVLGAAFGRVEGIAVDTHVKRLAQRLGLSRETAPEKVEKDLMRIYPTTRWGGINHLFIAHGRETCTARRPACSHCLLADLCPRLGVENPR
jgi:endonuclease-3